MLLNRKRALAAFAAAFLIAAAAGAVDPDYNRVANFGTPIVDGDLSDPVWQAADWQEMDVYAGGARPAGFEARSAVLWDDDYLYTAIEVDDDTHASPPAVVDGTVNLWKGDSPQHRVDLEYDSAPASPDDIEWGYALQDGKILTHAWSSANNIDFVNMKIVRDEAAKKTYYECAVVLRMHKPNATLSEYVSDNRDAVIGYSDMVNANDGGDRLGWLEWSSGIGASKNADLFGTLSFDHTPFSVNPKGKAATAWAALKR